MMYVTASVWSGWSVQSSAAQNASAVAAFSPNRPPSAGSLQRPANDAEERQRGQEMDGTS